MLRDENGTLWLFPGEDTLEVSKEKLLEIINRMETVPVYDVQRYIGPESEEDKELFERQHPTPEYWVNEPADEDCWQSDVGDEADGLFYELLDQWEKKFREENIALNSNIHTYPHSDPRSIDWEAFEVLQNAVPNELRREELPVLREFLNTPPGKEEEAWKKWEAYWDEREKKRIEKSDEASDPA